MSVGESLEWGKTSKNVNNFPDGRAIIQISVIYPVPRLLLGNWKMTELFPR